MFLFIHLKHHSILSSFCDSRWRLYLPSPTFSQEHLIFSFIAFPIPLTSVPKFTTVATNQTESKTLCSALSILPAFCNAPTCKMNSNTSLCIIWNPTLYLVIAMATDPDTHLRNFHQDSPINFSHDGISRAITCCHLIYYYRVAILDQLKIKGISISFLTCVRGAKAN